MRITCTVNGALTAVDEVPADETLLHFLRDRLGLMGTKNACEQGECGSCAVQLHGTLVCSCLVLAGQADQRRVATIEGLASDGGLNYVQTAFAEAGAVQCGYCTPGLVMAAHTLLETQKNPNDDEIREALAGNLCRCTGYQKVIDAVHTASRVAGGESAALSVIMRRMPGSCARPARPG